MTLSLDIALELVLLHSANFLLAFAAAALALILLFWIKAAPQMTL